MLLTTVTGGLLASGCVSRPVCPAGGTGSLECRAAEGDKTAQLELGKAYEGGVGVPLDPKRAARLYEAASEASPGTMYIYSPAVGRSRAGVIPVRRGADRPGLPEAKYRLGKLYETGSGVRFDPAFGRKLQEQAIRAGYVASPMPD